MKVNVLVVDDNANERIIAETLLRARGFQVRGAADGCEAREILTGGSADIVVLDLALEGMNGLELIRWLRGRFESLPPARPPKIVVASKPLPPEAERFTRRLGADAVLTKPLNPRAFLDTVGRLAGEHVGLRAVS